MKYLILLLSLLSFSCSQEFHVGDCIRNKNYFKCKHNDNQCHIFSPVVKIVEANDKRYKLAFHSAIFPSKTYKMDHMIISHDFADYYRKVECTDELKDYRE